MNGFVLQPVQHQKSMPDIFNDLIAKGSVDVIDVREPDEMPVVNEFSNIKIPLAAIIGPMHP